MVLSQQRVHEIAAEFRRELEVLYGPRLRQVMLYGSYARGEAREDSDIDIAVVLEGEVSRAEERERLSEVRASLSLRENCLIMPFVVSARDFQARRWAIHRSIAREGVPL